jgi:hypothetical protein
LAVTNHKVEFLLTLSTPARGVPYGIFTKHGGNAEDIPDSVAIIAFIVNLGHKVRWQAGERVSHPDSMRSWSEGNMMCIRQPFIGTLNCGNRAFEMIGSYECCRWTGCFDKRRINEMGAAPL